MAAPQKDGLDYYTLDVGFLDDDKVRDILDKEECGPRALMILLYIWSKCYGDKGYYFEINQKTYKRIRQYFDYTGDINEGFVKKVITLCVEGELFNGEMFNRFGILTSARIQRMYLRGAAGRGEIRIIKEYFLLDIDNSNEVPESILNKLVFKSHSRQNNGVIEQNNGVIESDNLQSKVKERKEKKRYIFAPPSLEDVKAYCEERGNSVDPERFIDFYSSKNWMIGRNKMSDWKAAVRTWEKNQKKVKGSKPDYSDLEEYEAMRKKYGGDKNG